MLKFISRRRKKEPTVSVETEDGDRKLAVRDAVTVLELLVKNGIQIPSSCGGMGTCGTCRIEVLDAPPEFAERNEVEAEFAAERGFALNERLGCQCSPMDQLKIRVSTNQSK